MNITRTRSIAIATLVAAMAFGTAACSSSDDSSTPTPAPTTSAPNKAPIADVASVGGKQTAVTLNMETIKALEGLGVKVTPNGTAKGVTLEDGAAVAFPITGGRVTVYDPASGVTPFVVGEIDHAGSGLTFTAGKKVLKATDFVIDPGNPAKLSATLDTGSGAKMKGVDLFTLDGSQVKISKDGDAYKLDGTKVLLMPAAARVMEGFFGAKANSIPDNAEIGIAHLVVTGK